MGSKPKENKNFENKPKSSESEEKENFENEPQSSESEEKENFENEPQSSESEENENFENEPQSSESEENESLENESQSSEPKENENLENKSLRFVELLELPGIGKERLHEIKKDFFTPLSLWEYFHCDCESDPKKFADYMKKKYKMREDNAKKLAEFFKKWEKNRIYQDIQKLWNKLFG